MGRTKGSKNRPKGEPVTFTGITPKVIGESPTAAKKEAWSELDWKVAEELHATCGIPGCTIKNHLFGARRVIELVGDYNR